MGAKIFSHRWLLGGFLLMGGLGLCPAQGQESGGTESPFELGGSARTLGMGGVGVAFAGDGSSFFINPATLATQTEQEILTFHSPLLADSSYDALGFILPVGPHTSFGAAIERVSTSGILQTTDSISSVSTIADEQLQGLFGYGFQLEDGFSVGGNFKYVRQQLGSYQDNGMGVDLGALYQFGRTGKDFSQFGLNNIAIGFSVSNVVAPENHLFSITDQPVRVYRPAISYHFQSLDLSSSLWLGVEGQMEQGGTNHVLAGLEYGWNNLLFGRVGFDGVSPTAGAGVRLSGLEFDYAFNQRDLGALQRFSLTYSFGQYHNPLDGQKMNTMKFIAKTYDRENEYDAAIQAWKSEASQFPDDPEGPAAIKSLQDRREKAIQGNIAEGREALD
jgi:hypothetical protein